MGFVFYPASTARHFSYVRLNFLALVATIGGLLYSLRSISNGMVKGLSNFGLDNSIMKFLYSSDKPGSMPDLPESK